MQRLQPKPLTRQWPITLLLWVTPTYTVFLPTLPPPFSPSPIRLSLSFFRRCGIAIVSVDEVKVFCKGGRLCSLTTSNETVHGWINRHAYARGCDRVNATPTLARRFKLCPCPDSALRTPPHSDGLGLAINVSLYAWILSLPCPYHQLHFHFCECLLVLWSCMRVSSQPDSVRVVGSASKPISSPFSILCPILLFKCGCYYLIYFFFLFSVCQRTLHIASLKSSRGQEIVTSFLPLSVFFSVYCFFLFPFFPHLSSLSLALALSFYLILLIPQLIITPSSSPIKYRRKNTFRPPLRFSSRFEINCWSPRICRRATFSIRCVLRRWSR